MAVNRTEWESRTRNGRWAHLRRWPGAAGYVLHITDDGLRLVITAELSLTELRELHEFTGTELRLRAAAGRFHGGA